MLNWVNVLSPCDLQLLNVFTDVQLPIVFDEVGVFLCGPHGPPMRQYPCKRIRSDKLTPWAGI